MSRASKARTQIRPRRIVQVSFHELTCLHVRRRRNRGVTRKFRQAGDQIQKRCKITGLLVVLMQAQVSFAITRIALELPDERVCRSGGIVAQSLGHPAYG